MRETESEQQKEKETQNPKQAPGSEQSAQSLTGGSNLQTVRSWPELKSDAQLTEPPKHPGKKTLLTLFQTLFSGLFSLISCKEWIVYKQKLKNATLSKGLGLKNIRDLDFIRSMNKMFKKQS